MNVPNDIPRHPFPVPLPRKKRMYSLGRDIQASDPSLTTVDNTPATAWTMQLYPQCWYYFKAKIAGFDTGMFGEVYAAEIAFRIYVDTTSGAVQMGSTDVISSYNPSGAPWTYTVDIDSPSAIVSIIVEGSIDRNVAWNVEVEISTQFLS